MTAALNQNRLLRLGQGTLASSQTFQGTRQEEGYPIFGLWGREIESFADANGNGIIEPTEVVASGPNSSFIGSSFPTREATAAPYVRLFGQRLHLSGLIQYRGGFFRPLFDTSLNPCAPENGPSCRAANDPSTPLGEQARAVALTQLGAQGDEMRDASALLLREFSLGFSVPPALARAVGAQTGQLVLGGRNLALLWKASDVPFENGQRSAEGASSNHFFTPGPTTYWLLRVNLTY